MNLFSSTPRKSVPPDVRESIASSAHGTAFQVYSTEADLRNAHADAVKAYRTFEKEQGRPADDQGNPDGKNFASATTLATDLEVKLQYGHYLLRQNAANTVNRLLEAVGEPTDGFRPRIAFGDAQILPYPEESREPIRWLKASEAAEIVDSLGSSSVRAMFRTAVTVEEKTRARAAAFLASDGKQQPAAETGTEALQRADKDIVDLVFLAKAYYSYAEDFGNATDIPIRERVGAVLHLPSRKGVGSEQSGAKYHTAAGGKAS
jgi:hypothetical protein